MDVEEMLASLRNPPEEGLPETIYDDISNAYNGVVESASSLSAQKDETIATLQAEIAQWKAMNFDLMMKLQGSNGDGEGDDPGPDDEYEDTPSVEELYSSEDED